MSDVTWACGALSWISWCTGPPLHTVLHDCAWQVLSVVRPEEVRLQLHEVVTSRTHCHPKRQEPRSKTEEPFRAVCRYAWYKLYNLAKGYNKNLTSSDVQMLAGNVLLSALAISPYSAADSARSEADAEQEKERSARMANLLGFTVVGLLKREPYLSLLAHRLGCLSASTHWLSAHGQSPFLTSFQ